MMISVHFDVVIHVPIKNYLTCPSPGGSSSEVVTVYGCENHTVALNCPRAHGLSIVRANYGR